jgi:hypothetical protein
VIDKFLENQKQIQDVYPNSQIIMATEDSDYLLEVKKLLKIQGLKGDVIEFKTIEPNNAKSRLWKIASGRESLRKYSLKFEAEYYLLLDSDMVYDILVIDILISKIKNYDVIFSGYKARIWNTLTFGAGCLLINRSVYQKISFRCIEFKNNIVFQEDELFEVDSYSKHARIKKGIFLTSKHFRNANEYNAIEPDKVGLIRRFTTLPIIRFILIKLEIFMRYRIADKAYISILRKRPT